MNNTKHTPGPWTMRKSQHDERHYAVHAASAMRFVAHVATHPSVGQAMENNEANARLIAAAPDGLAANIKARDAILDVLGTGMIGSDGLIAATLRDAMQACNAAIAKATND
jgi:hypothetical protein